MFIEDYDNYYQIRGRSSLGSQFTSKRYDKVGDVVETAEKLTEIGFTSLKISCIQKKGGSQLWSKHYRKLRDKLI